MNIMSIVLFGLLIIDFNPWMKYLDAMCCSMCHNKKTLLVLFSSKITNNSTFKFEPTLVISRLYVKILDMIDHKMLSK